MRRTEVPDEETLRLVARVLAWAEGEDDCDHVAGTVAYQDSAQQACEDLGLA